jgi:membrane-associated protease RseP (regulator of RpoE activity)
MSSKATIILVAACFIALVFLAAAPVPPTPPAPAALAEAPVPPAPAAPTWPVATAVVTAPVSDGETEVRVVTVEVPAAPAAPEASSYSWFGASGSWLGVSIADVDADRAAALALTETMGAEVKSVTPESPADKAGIKKGDVIMKYQGAKVRSVAQLTRLVRETPAGRQVEIEVHRDGSTLILEVEVEERRSRHDFHKIIRKINIPHIEIPDIEMPEIDIPDIELPHLNFIGAHHGTVLLGVSVEALTAQLRDYFGAEEDVGVLVRSVKEGSAAQEAGLRAGDVITGIDGETIDKPSSLRRALRERHGEQIEITILREQRERSLKATLPEEEDSGRHEAWEWSDEPPHAEPREELHEETEGVREHRDRMREQRSRMHEQRDRMREQRRHMLEEHRRLREEQIQLRDQARRLGDPGRRPRALKPAADGVVSI